MTIEEAVRNAMCGKCIPYRKETKGKLNEILQENAELKRLLKLAVEDFEKLDCSAGCGVCIKGQDVKYCYNIGFKWEHADEAMKILKGE